MRDAGCVMRRTENAERRTQNAERRTPHSAFLWYSAPRNDGASFQGLRDFDTMQTPAKLRVAVQARSLALAVYSATSGFPAREQYGLSAQMRRAAIAVGSNIYEGCGRQ